MKIVSLWIPISNLGTNKYPNSGPASNVNNAAVSTDAVVEYVLKGVNISDLFDD